MRQTLQAASVLGSNFPTSLLQQISNLPSTTLNSHLDLLADRQFLTAQSYRSEPGYVFYHALLQESVYSTLLKRDRSHIHLRVAEAIEAGTLWPQEEQVATLAYHYVKSSIPTKAIPYSIAAADHAARQCAYETASDYYSQALQLLPDEPEGCENEFFQVRIGLGQALKYMGELSSAAALLEGVQQLLQTWRVATTSLTLWPMNVEVLRQIADIRQREGAFDDAMNWLNEGRRILEENVGAESIKLQSALLDRMAWIHFRQGQLTEAEVLGQEAIASLITSNTNAPILLASLYNTLGGVAWQQGNLNTAITYVEQCLQLHQQTGYLRGKAVATANLGVLHDAQGNWSQAVIHYEQSLALQQTAGDRQNQAVNLINLGVMYMRIGEHDVAQNKLEEGLSIVTQIGDTVNSATAYVNLAELAIIQEDFTVATHHVNDALRIADEIESAELQSQARRLSAYLLAKNEGELIGLDMAGQALKYANSSELHAEKANCHHVLGVLNTLAGEYESAEMEFQQALTLMQKQNDPFRRGQTRLSMGQLYQKQAQTDNLISAKWWDKALTALNEAEKEFQSIGAMYYLDLTKTTLLEMQAVQQL